MAKRLKSNLKDNSQELCNKQTSVHSCFSNVNLHVEWKNVLGLFHELKELINVCSEELQYSMEFVEKVKQSASVMTLELSNLENDINDDDLSCEKSDCSNEKNTTIGIDNYSDNLLNSLRMNNSIRRYNKQKNSIKSNSKSSECSVESTCRKGCGKKLQKKMKFNSVKQKSRLKTALKNAVCNGENSLLLPPVKYFIDIPPQRYHDFPQNIFEARDYLSKPTSTSNSKCSCNCNGKCKHHVEANSSPNELKRDCRSLQKLSTLRNLKIIDPIRFYNNESVMNRNTQPFKSKSLDFLINENLAKYKNIENNKQNKFISGSKIKECPSNSGSSSEDSFMGFEPSVHKAWTQLKDQCESFQAAVNTLSNTDNIQNTLKQSIERNLNRENINGECALFQGPAPEPIAIKRLKQHLKFPKYLDQYTSSHNKIGLLNQSNHNLKSSQDDPRCNQKSLHPPNYHSQRSSQDQSDWCYLKNSQNQLNFCNQKFSLDQSPYYSQKFFQNQPCCIQNSLKNQPDCQNRESLPNQRNCDNQRIPRSGPDCLNLKSSLDQSQCYNHKCSQTQTCCNQGGQKNQSDGHSPNQRTSDNVKSFHNQLDKSDFNIQPRPQKAVDLLNQESTHYVPVTDNKNNTQPVHLNQKSSKSKSDMKTSKLRIIGTDKSNVIVRLNCECSKCIEDPVYKIVKLEHNSISDSTPISTVFGSRKSKSISNILAAIASKDIYLEREPSNENVDSTLNKSIGEMTMKNFAQTTQTKDGINEVGYPVSSCFIEKNNTDGNLYENEFNPIDKSFNEFRKQRHVMVNTEPTVNIELENINLDQDEDEILDQDEEETLHLDQDEEETLHFDQYEEEIHVCNHEIQTLNNVNPEHGIWDPNWEKMRPDQGETETFDSIDNQQENSLNSNEHFIHKSMNSFEPKPGPYVTIPEVMEMCTSTLHTKPQLKSRKILPLNMHEIAEPIDGTVNIRLLPKGSGLKYKNKSELAYSSTLKQKRNSDEKIKNSQILKETDTTMSKRLQIEQNSLSIQTDEFNKPDLPKNILFEPSNSVNNQSTLDKEIQVYFVSNNHRQENQFSCGSTDGKLLHGCYDSIKTSNKKSIPRNDDIRKSKLQSVYYKNHNGSNGNENELGENPGNKFSSTRVKNASTIISLSSTDLDIKQPRIKENSLNESSSDISKYNLQLASKRSKCNNFKSLADENIEKEYSKRKSILQPLLHEQCNFNKHRKLQGYDNSKICNENKKSSQNVSLQCNFMSCENVKGDILDDVTLKKSISKCYKPNYKTKTFKLKKSSSGKAFPAPTESKISPSIHIMSTVACTQTNAIIEDTTNTRLLNKIAENVKNRKLKELEEKKHKKVQADPSGKILVLKDNTLHYKMSKTHLPNRLRKSNKIQPREADQYKEHRSSNAKSRSCDKSSEIYIIDNIRVSSSEVKSRYNNISFTSFNGNNLSKVPRQIKGHVNQKVKDKNVVFYRRQSNPEKSVLGKVHQRKSNYMFPESLIERSIQNTTNPYVYISQGVPIKTSSCPEKDLQYDKTDNKNKISDTEVSFINFIIHKGEKDKSVKLTNTNIKETLMLESEESCSFLKRNSPTLCFNKPNVCDENGNDHEINAESDNTNQSKATDSICSNQHSLTFLPLCDNCRTESEINEIDVNSNYKCYSSYDNFKTIKSFHEQCQKLDDKRKVKEASCNEDNLQNKTKIRQKRLSDLVADSKHPNLLPTKVMYNSYFKKQKSSERANYESRGMNTENFLDKDMELKQSSHRVGHDKLENVERTKITLPDGRGDTALSIISFHMTNLQSIPKDNSNTLSTCIDRENNNAYCNDVDGDHTKLLKLEKISTKREYANKNPININSKYNASFFGLNQIEVEDISKSTIGEYVAVLSKLSSMLAEQFNLTTEALRLTCGKKKSTLQEGEIYHNWDYKKNPSKSSYKQIFSVEKGGQDKQKQSENDASTNTASPKSKSKIPMQNDSILRINKSTLQFVHKELCNLKAQVNLQLFRDIRDKIATCETLPKSEHEKVLQNIDAELLKIGSIKDQIDRILDELQQKIAIEDELEALHRRLEQEFVSKFEYENLKQTQAESLTKIKYEAIMETKNQLNEKLREINELIQHQIQEQVRLEKARTNSELSLKKRLENIGDVLRTELSSIQAALAGYQSDQSPTVEKSDLDLREPMKTFECKRKNVIEKSMSLDERRFQVPLKMMTPKNSTASNFDEAEEKDTTSIIPKNTKQSIEDKINEGLKEKYLKKK